MLPAELEMEEQPKVADRAPLARTVGGFVEKSNPTLLPKYHFLVSFCAEEIKQQRVRMKLIIEQ